MIRSISSLCLIAATCLLFEAQALAQKSITLSTPAKDGTDIITIRYKQGAETKAVDVKVPVSKGLDPKVKAKRFEDAINENDDLKKKVSASVNSSDPNTIDITPKDGITIRKVKLTGATGERDDAMADVSDDIEDGFSLQITGILEYADPDGDPSYLMVGTDNVTVEYPLVSGMLPHQIAAGVVDMLVEQGIEAEFVEPAGIGFTYVQEEQGAVRFGCSDAGAVLVTSLEFGENLAPQADQLRVPFAPGYVERRAMLGSIEAIEQAGLWVE